MNPQAAPSKNAIFLADIQIVYRKKCSLAFHNCPSHSARADIWPKSRWQAHAHIFAPLLVNPPEIGTLHRFICRTSIPNGGFWNFHPIFAFPTSPIAVGCVAQIACDLGFQLRLRYHGTERWLGIRILLWPDAMPPVNVLNCSLISDALQT